MSKMEIVDVPRRVEKVAFLGYHGATCPHCQKQIFIPEYRQQPVTLEELQRRTKEDVENMKKIKVKAK